MAVTLGPVTFDEAHTTVSEKLDEVGGRNEREVTISGMIVGQNTVAAIESQIDAILDAASVEDFSAELNLRSGRRLFVRRKTFKREVQGAALVGAFTVELEAKDTFEESTALTTVNWIVTASGQTKAAASAGTVYAKPKFSLVATGTIVDPAISDGTRTLAYSGTVQDGETLELDMAASTATLEGVDVLPYTSGRFPRISPEGTTLTYTDGAASTHTAQITVTYRDRWW